MRQVTIVSNHAGAWYRSHLLLFIGVVLTVPVVLRLTHTLTDRSPRLAFLGGELAGVGAICFAALLTIGFVVWQMAGPGADQGQMSALFRRLFHAPEFIIPFELLPLGFAIGMTMLAVGLRNARVVSRWTVICIGTGATGLSLVGIVPGSAYAVAVSVVFALGLVPLGLTALGVRATCERSLTSTVQATRSDLMAG